VTFSRRLTLFFVLIVVLPMIAVAILLIQVSRDSAAGKSDARLAASLGTATAVHRGLADGARVAARALAADAATVQALRAESRSAARKAAEADLRGSDLTAVILLDASGQELARAGAGDALAFGSIAVRQGSRELGTVLGSRTSAEAYLRQVRLLTGSNGVLMQGERPVAASGGLSGADIPRSGDVTIDGRELRARSATIAPAAGGSGALTLTLLGPRESAGVIGSEPLVAAALLAFLALALLLILPLLRDLGGLHDRVAGQAVTDELTGLSNHRRFRELMRKEVGRANRFDRPLSVLLVDIDDFKRVNDTHGHLQGDRVLQRVAEVLRAASREVDEPARYGGEEFAVALPETPGGGGRGADSGAGRGDAGPVGERRRDRSDGERRLGIDLAGNPHRGGGADPGCRPGSVCGQAGREEPGRKQRRGNPKRDLSPSGAGRGHARFMPAHRGRIVQDEGTGQSWATGGPNPLSLAFPVGSWNGRA
jgi:GGDEF domain-containing protein